MNFDIGFFWTVVTSLGGTALSLWGWSYKFRDQQKRVLQEYANAQVKARDFERDINHLKRDYEQLSANVAHLDEEYEQHFRELEAVVHKMQGSIEVLLSRAS